LSAAGQDGIFRPFLTRSCRCPRCNRRVYGWIGTHIDISERKRSEGSFEAPGCREAALRNLRETQNSLIEAEKLAALAGWSRASRMRSKPHSARAEGCLRDGAEEPNVRGAGGQDAETIKPERICRGSAGRLNQLLESLTAPPD